MTDFRRVTDDYSVAPQIAPEDLAVAKEQGFVLVINNRPDGESPGQPSSAVMEAAAKAEGLDYFYNPVRGLPPGEEQVAARHMREERIDVVKATKLVAVLPSRPKSNKYAAIIAWALPLTGSSGMPIAGQNMRASVVSPPGPRW